MLQATQTTFPDGALSPAPDLTEGAPASLCEHAQSLSRVQLSATPWTVARQAPLAVGFSRQEYWDGLHALLQGNLPSQLSTRESQTSRRGAAWCRGEKPEALGDLGLDLPLPLHKLAALAKSPPLPSLSVPLHTVGLPVGRKSEHNGPGPCAP